MENLAIAMDSNAAAPAELGTTADTAAHVGSYINDVFFDTAGTVTITFADAASAIDASLVGGTMVFTTTPGSSPYTWGCTVTPGTGLTYPGGLFGTTCN